MVEGYSKALDNLLDMSSWLGGYWLSRPDSSTVDGTHMAELLINKGDALFCSEGFVALAHAAYESLPEETPQLDVSDFISDCGTVTFEQPVSMSVYETPPHHEAPKLREELWFGFTWFCGVEQRSRGFIAEIFPQLKPVVGLEDGSAKSYFLRRSGDTMGYLETVNKFLKAIWLLARQSSVAEVSHEAPERHARKRAERRGSRSGVIVIRLPKRIREHSGEGGSVDWQHRWIVRGHWRQQPWGPERSHVRPVWIAPYIKGPEGKPLIAPARRLFVAGGIDG